MGRPEQVMVDELPSFLEGVKDSRKLFPPPHTRPQEKEIDSTAENNHHSSFKIKPTIIAIKDSVEAFRDLPEIDLGPSLDQLAIRRMPRRVHFGTNGHFPLGQLGNAVILRIIQNDEVAPKKNIQPIKPDRRFVERHGTLMKRIDHHYAGEDWANRHRDSDKPTYKRHTLTTAELLHSEGLIEEAYPEAPENWESYLQMNTPPAIDWSLFPEDRK